MKQYIKKLKIKNLLSFGKGGVEMELNPLNVFIGTNGSGKSNVMEVLALIRSLPEDLATRIRISGGIEDVIWKGSANSEALIDINVPPLNHNSVPIHHRITFAPKGQSFEVTDESIENSRETTGSDKDDHYFYRYNRGNPVISSFEEETRKLRFFNKDDRLDTRQSILSQRKDPLFYPELTYLSSLYRGIRIYNNWVLGSDSVMRKPHKTDLPEDFLTENGENLGLVLNDIEHRTDGRERIQYNMKQLFEDFEDYSVKIHAGTVQVYLKEKGLKSPVPSNRLSDGTLRYLSLLAILCHPDPPGIVCIEEPELGLHPDMIGQIAKLAIDASSRTQLFITTHSDIFIDALKDHLESVFIVEKESGETRIHQEDGNIIKEWIKDYSLGQLWRKGEIGGNRW